MNVEKWKNAAKEVLRSGNEAALNEAAAVLLAVSEDQGLEVIDDLVDGVVQKETKSMTKLDLSRPVQTRDGRAARIICSDAKTDGDYPIVALVTLRNGYEEIFAFTPTGQYRSSVEGDYDLVNVPEKIVGWANVSQEGSKFWLGWLHETEELARADSSTEIARIRIEFEEGQFDE